MGILLLARQMVLLDVLMEILGLLDGKLLDLIEELLLLFMLMRIILFQEEKTEL